MNLFHYGIWSFLYSPVMHSTKLHFDVVYYIYVLLDIMQIARIKIAFNLVISYLPQMNTSYVWNIRIRLQSNLKYAITSMGSLKEVLLFSWIKNCCFNRNFNNPLHFCRKNSHSINSCLKNESVGRSHLSGCICCHSNR